MLKMKQGFTVWMLALCLGLSACQRNREVENEPRKRLSEYISRSFAVRGAEDRNRLQELLTGEAKARLSSWSDDQFRSAFVDSKRTFVKLVFKEVKPAGDSRVAITYELTYLSRSGSKDTKITQKKLCSVEKVAGNWLIGQVQNIKELVEYQDEMSLP